MSEHERPQPTEQIIFHVQREPLRPAEPAPPPPPPPPSHPRWRLPRDWRRAEDVVEHAIVGLPHVLLFLVPLCSSDPRSLSSSLVQALAVLAGLLLLWRRPWPVLGHWERVLLVAALVLLMGPGMPAWSGSAEMLRATTEIRAWSAWMLLLAAIALAPEAARRWPGLLWIPSLVALAMFQLGIGYAWWGTGGPVAARVLLGPSLAVALFAGRWSGSRWLRLPQVLASAAIAFLLLLWEAAPEMFAFLLVALMVAPRRKTLSALTLLLVAWWAVATPHHWMHREEALVPELGKLHARAALVAPGTLFRPERAYGWVALRVARAQLPYGAGPGHEAPLLVRAPLEANLYPVPGAFIWEGMVSLGWGFFLALAGFLMLQALADADQERTRHTRGARGLLFGLWLPAFYLPLSGFLSNPAWWAALGMLAALRVPSLGHGYPRRERRGARIAAGVLAFLVCFPLARQTLAELAYRHPERLHAISAGDVGRLLWAARWEPGNGAYHFALAHAVYERNLEAAGGKSYKAVDDTVLSELRVATEREPYNGVYRWVYSRFLLLAGKWDEALAQQSRAIQLAPGRLEYRRSMAETCENLGRLMLALHEYRACADLDPFDATLRVGIARVLGALDHPELARLEYEKALRLDPDNELALRRLMREKGAAELGVY